MKQEDDTIYVKKPFTTKLTEHMVIVRDHGSVVERLMSGEDGKFYKYVVTRSPGKPAQKSWQYINAPMKRREEKSTSEAE